MKKMMLYTLLILLYPYVGINGASASSSSSAAAAAGVDQRGKTAADDKNKKAAIASVGASSSAAAQAASAGKAVNSVASTKITVNYWIFEGGVFHMKNSGNFKEVDKNAPLKSLIDAMEKSSLYHYRDARFFTTQQALAAAFIDKSQQDLVATLGDKATVGQFLAKLQRTYPSLEEYELPVLAK